MGAHPTLIDAHQTMGLSESTVEATDGDRSGRGGEDEGEDPSIITSRLPDEFTSRFEVLGEVGKGSFGRVYKVRDKKTKAVYATKHQKCNDSNMKEVRVCSSYLWRQFFCRCNCRLGWR